MGTLTIESMSVGIKKEEYKHLEQEFLACLGYNLTPRVFDTCLGEIRLSDYDEVECLGYGRQEAESLYEIYNQVFGETRVSYTKREISSVSDSSYEIVESYMPTENKISVWESFSSYGFPDDDYERHYSKKMPKDFKISDYHKDKIEKIIGNGTDEDYKEELCSREIFELMREAVYLLSDFKIKDGVLKKYQGNETIVQIPEGVTTIGEEAFAYCRRLREINIPEGVTAIGDWAFYGCSRLKEINISEGVTSIGGGAFSGCSRLKEINIPEGVTKIGDWAFSGCSRLEIILKIKEASVVAKFNKVLNGTLIAIRSYFIPVTEFPDAQTKKFVVLGYAKGLQEGENFSQDVVEKNNKYIKSQRKKLFDFAVTETDLLKFMLDEKMFKLEEVPALIEKVTEAGNTVVADMLLEYRETKFSEKEKEKFAKKQLKL